MDFNTTDEQTMLREMVSRYFADTYSFDNRMKTVHGGKGWNPAVWQTMAEELGILGAPFSEAHGGLGGGAIENMIVMEEIGRATVGEIQFPETRIGEGMASAKETLQKADDLTAALTQKRPPSLAASAEPGTPPAPPKLPHPKPSRFNIDFRQYGRPR